MRSEYDQCTYGKRPTVIPFELHDLENGVLETQLDQCADPVRAFMREVPEWRSTVYHPPVPGRKSKSAISEIGRTTEQMSFLLLLQLYEWTENYLSTTMIAKGVLNFKYEYEALKDTARYWLKSHSWAVDDFQLLHRLFVAFRVRANNLCHIAHTEGRLDPSQTPAVCAVQAMKWYRPYLTVINVNSMPGGQSKIMFNIQELWDGKLSCLSFANDASFQPSGIALGKNAIAQSRAESASWGLPVPPFSPLPFDAQGQYMFLRRNRCPQPLLQFIDTNVEWLKALRVLESAVRQPISEDTALPLAYLLNIYRLYADQEDHELPWMVFQTAELRAYVRLWISYKHDVAVDFFHTIVVTFLLIENNKLAMVRHTEHKLDREGTCEAMSFMRVWLHGSWNICIEFELQSGVRTAFTLTFADLRADILQCVRLEDPGLIQPSWIRWGSF